jgi:hypothetical protein
MKTSNSKVPSVRIMYEDGVKRSEKIILADTVRAAVLRIEGFSGNRGLSDEYFTGNHKLFIKFSGVLKRARFLRDIGRRLPEYLSEKIDIDRVRVIAKPELKVRPKAKVIPLFSAAR